MTVPVVRRVERPSGAAPAVPARQEWLVELCIPVEADSPAEAAARFWEHVRELGPAELPAFVSPVGDELALRPYVLGAEVNLDPEEEDEDV